MDSAVNLPPGFVLDEQPNALPPGFVLDKPSVAGDVAKQIGTGLVLGTEAIPAFPAHAANALTAGALWAANKVAPDSDTVKRWNTQEAERQAQMKEFAAKYGNPGLTDYLPKPETTAGQYARSGAEFVPSALALRGNLARNAATGTIAGLGSEAAGQATQGTAAEPFARVVGAVVSGAAGMRGAEAAMNRVAARGVPQASALQQSARDAYQDLTASHVATPIAQSDLTGLASNIRDTLNRGGVRPSVADKIHKALDELEQPATKGAPDVADLVAARQNIKQLLSSPDANKAGASIALPKIDAAIEGLSPGTMQKLRAADKDWAAFKASEAVDKKIARAEMRAQGADSGLNLGNKIRQKVADYLLSNESKYLSPQNRAALEQVVKGTTTQNMLRLASNAMGGGGGIGSTLLGLSGAAGGAYTGHPELAALPIGGIGLRMLANRSVARQAANAGAMIRARAPSSQAAGIVGPAPRLPRQQAALLAALYAAPAMRGVLALDQPAR